MSAQTNTSAGESLIAVLAPENGPERAMATGLLLKPIAEAPATAASSTTRDGKHARRDSAVQRIDPVFNESNPSWGDPRRDVHVIEIRKRSIHPFLDLLDSDVAAMTFVMEPFMHRRRHAQASIHAASGSPVQFKLRRPRLASWRAQTLPSTKTERRILSWVSG